MSVFSAAGNVFLDIIETVVVALSVFLVIYLFFMQPHQVNGQSMEPTFLNSEYVLTDKVSYQTGTPHRGDVVVFHAPEAAGCPANTGCDFIKRVIGIPGDTIRVADGGYYVNEVKIPEPYIPPENVTMPGEFTQGGRQVSLGADEYFVSGDNRPYSSDSRVWGPISKKAIVGRAFLRYWPLNKITIIPRVTYGGLQ